MLDDHARKVSRNAKKNFDADVERIRSDKTLSDHGRREALQTAYDQTMKTVNTVKAEHEKKREAQRSELARRLFGLPPAARPDEVASFRDAADRVAKIADPEELGRLMQSAHDVGDRDLLKAAASAAFARSGDIRGGTHYTALVDEYAETTATGSDLAAYRATMSTSSLQASMLELMETTPSKPAELKDHRPKSDVAPPPQRNALGLRVASSQGSA